MLSEMQRLMALEEQHRQTVKAKEMEMVRIKEELETFNKGAKDFDIH